MFLPIYYTEASQILTTANKTGYEPIFFGCDGMDGILDVEGFDTSLAEGLMLLTPFAADAQDEKTQAFVSAYVAAYGETPNQFAADSAPPTVVVSAAAVLRERFLGVLAPAAAPTGSRDAVFRDGFSVLPLSCR